MIVPSASRNESKIDSTGSQVSTLFTSKLQVTIYINLFNLVVLNTGYGEGEHLLIPELDEVIDAIRQPDDILSKIIADLVIVEDIVDEEKPISETSSEHEDIDEICGVAAVSL